MLYIIFGDLHGRSITDIEKYIAKADMIICTGDFDETRTIQEIQEIKKPTIVVPGNHDDAILAGLNISSGILRERGRTASELHQNLIRDENARIYIEGLLENPIGYLCIDPDRFGEKYKAIVVHGGLSGNLRSCPDCSPNKQILWHRLESKIDYRNNFIHTLMPLIMIRGHDHNPTYAYYDENGVTIIKNPSPFYRLDPNKKHIITPGAFYYGYFAVLGTYPHEPYPIVAFYKI